MSRIGVDISHFQTTVHLATAKPHVAFVFLKATDGSKDHHGNMFVDHTFAPRWQQLADLHIPRGAFHYARLNSSATAQADHFIEVVRRNGFRGGDAAMLDLEDVPSSTGMSPAALLRWVDHWVAKVRSALPVQKVVFYTGLSYWKDVLRDPPSLPDGCIGMLSHYNRHGPYAGPLGHPRAWPDPPAIWQFTDGTTQDSRIVDTPGIGKVDTDEMTDATFEALFAGAGEDDDFMALFDSLDEFKAALAAVVRGEAEKVVREELTGTYHLLAHGGEQVPTDPGDTHLQESHLGLRRPVGERVADAYRLLARGELDGTVDPAGDFFKDSNRHLAQLAEAVAAATGARP
jgi:hypothetical protein